MQAVRQIESLFKNVPGLGWAASGHRQFIEWFDIKMWDEFHMPLKMVTAYVAGHTGLELYPEIDPNKLKNDVGKRINSMFGGLRWSEEFWASPKVVSWLRAAQLSPDWTFSQIKQSFRPILETFGIKGKNATEFGKNLDRRYWFNMMIGLIGWTAFHQFVIKKVFGEDDEEGEEFIWDNEPGHEWDIDITPLIREMAKVEAAARGLVGADITAELERRLKGQRYYAHFGKQVREFMGWLTNPITMLRRKSSPLLQVAVEQWTGSEGDGYDMKWVQQDSKGIENVFQRGEAILAKFVPFSLRGSSFAFTIPMGKGMTSSKANRYIEAAMDAYADPKPFTLSPDMNYVEALSTLVEEVLDAAEKNQVGKWAQMDAGLITKDAYWRDLINRGKSRVSGRYNTELFLALRNGNHDKMNAAALKIVRLHGGINKLNQSARARGLILTDEETEYMERAVTRAQEKLGVDISGAASTALFYLRLLKPDTVKINLENNPNPDVRTTPRAPFKAAKERRFQEWYDGLKGPMNLSDDPDDVAEQYDYRSAWNDLNEPKFTLGFHFPSKFKLAGHPRRVVGGVDTITGNVVR